MGRALLDLRHPWTNSAFGMALMNPLNVPTRVFRNGEFKAVSDSEWVMVRELAKQVSDVSARVPWLASPLVQAIAAQRLLLRVGVSSRVQIRLQFSESGELLSHPWLEVGGQAVVGGDALEFSSMMSVQTRPPHALACAEQDAQ